MSGAPTPPARGGLGDRLSRLFATRPAAAIPSLPPRPAARLVWLHSGQGLKLAVRDDLIMALLARPKTTLLLTGATQDLPEPARAYIIEQPLPDETQAAAFFDHFSPDALLWSGGIAHPKLMARLAQSGIPAALFNITAADLAFRRQRRHLAELVAGFASIYCAEQSAADLLETLGAHGPDIVQTGPLFPMVKLPTEDVAQRKTIAQRLAGRPVWAALGATPASLPHLAAAQAHARRAAPGLVMLVVPAAGFAAKKIEAKLSTLGIQTAALESGTIMPGALVLESAQAGLAARLAPVAVIADSLDAPGAQNAPLIAANLGAALIHGPHFGAYGEDFQRLLAANSSRILADNAKLGAVLVDLLRPDAAATMATSAWAMLSAGAETLEALSALAFKGAK